MNAAPAFPLPDSTSLADLRTPFAAAAVASVNGPNDSLFYRFEDWHCDLLSFYRRKQSELHKIRSQDQRSRRAADYLYVPEHQLRHVQPLPAKKTSILKGVDIAEDIF